MTYTISLKTNQSQLIRNLKHAFTPISMLGELLQNARRAGSHKIEIKVEDKSIIIDDDGSGIEDLQALIHIAESGWNSELRERENAFGMGVLSTLYFSDRITVHSLDHAFDAETALIIDGKSVTTFPIEWRAGTLIRLDGVRIPEADDDLCAWVGAELLRLCEAFPVPVYLNGVEVPRPLAQAGLQWRSVDVGKVLINLDHYRGYWRCFLQGLPIDQNRHRHSSTSGHVVILSDGIPAKLPDRQSLLGGDKIRSAIGIAVERAFREALEDEKKRLGGKSFLESYADHCLRSGCGDLLNDIPYALPDWFRDWKAHAPGLDGEFIEIGKGGETIERENLLQIGIWEIARSTVETWPAEVYLASRDAMFLVESLSDDHWIRRSARIIKAEDVVVRCGDEIFRDAQSFSREMSLVAEMTVTLRGEEEGYRISEFADDNTLYLTTDAAAYRAIRLVDDYMDDDRYNEERAERDIRRIDKFIHVGASATAAQIIRKLLPSLLEYTDNAKLANTRVSVTFDSSGRLLDVVDTHC